MKEQDLIDLGFERQEGENFYYFTYDFGNSSASLITPGNDEIKNDEWYVELFEDPELHFSDIEEVKILKEVLERNDKRRK